MRADLLCSFSCGCVFRKRYGERVSFLVLVGRRCRLFFREKERQGIELLPNEIREHLPLLYSQEEVEDPLVICKFFTPDSFWTWYALEFDGKDLFFGWVVGFEHELGYFRLSELTTARGPLGLPIERDLHFAPTRLSQVKTLHALG